MSGTNAYGQIVSRGDVEQATINTLNLWLEAYLEDYEVSRGFSVSSVERIGPNGVYSGLDPESFAQSDLPAVIVNAEPVERTEAVGDGIYQQWYSLVISALSVAGTEFDARMLADAYGTAVMGAIGQHGSLGGFAMDTRLELAPNARYLDPDRRRFGVADVTFQTLVPILDRRGGPSTPPAAGAQPQNYPPVTTVGVTVKAVPTTSPLK